MSRKTWGLVAVSTVAAFVIGAGASAATGWTVYASASERGSDGGFSVEAGGKSVKNPNQLAFRVSGRLDDTSTLYSEWQITCWGYGNGALGAVTRVTFPVRRDARSTQPRVLPTTALSKSRYSRGRRSQLRWPQMRATRGRAGRDMNRKAWGIMLSPPRVAAIICFIGLAVSLVLAG